MARAATVPFLAGPQAWGRFLSQPGPRSSVLGPRLPPHRHPQLGRRPAPHVVVVASSTAAAASPPPSSNGGSGQQKGAEPPQPPPPPPPSVPELQITGAARGRAGSCSTCTRLPPPACMLPRLRRAGHHHTACGDLPVTQPLCPPASGHRRALPPRTRLVCCCRRGWLSPPLPRLPLLLSSLTIAAAACLPAWLPSSPLCSPSPAAYHYAMFFALLGGGLLFLALLLYFTGDIEFQRAVGKVVKRLLKTGALRQLAGILGAMVFVRYGLEPLIKNIRVLMKAQGSWEKSSEFYILREVGAARRGACSVHSGSGRRRRHTSHAAPSQAAPPPPCSPSRFASPATPPSRPPLPLPPAPRCAPAAVQAPRVPVPCGRLHHAGRELLAAAHEPAQEHRADRGALHAVPHIRHRRRARRVQHQGPVRRRRGGGGGGGVVASGPRREGRRGGQWQGVWAAGRKKLAGAAPAETSPAHMRRLISCHRGPLRAAPCHTAATLAPRPASLPLPPLSLPCPPSPPASSASLHGSWS